MRVDKDAAVPHQTFEVVIAITMVIIAMIAIFAYPNFKNARNRGRQKRVMADFRNIQAALDSYHADFNLYPLGKTTIEGVRKELEPYLENELPFKDECGNHYIYRSDGPNSYTIISFGKDRQQDGQGIYQGIITTFENDIVFSNGSFIAIPEGQSQ